MKQLLTLSILAAVLFVAQPAHAQQQDTAKDTTSMQNMEMMQDSTMMGMCMKMMQNMKSDTTMSGMQGMMGGDMSNMCMKMCMGMMDGDMDMNKNNSQGDTKDEEKQGLN